MSHWAPTAPMLGVGVAEVVSVGVTLFEATGELVETTVELVETTGEGAITGAGVLFWETTF